MDFLFVSNLILRGVSGVGMSGIALEPVNL